MSGQCCGLLCPVTRKKKLVAAGVRPRWLMRVAVQRLAAPMPSRLVAAAVGSWGGGPRRRLLCCGLRCGRRCHGLVQAHGEVLVVGDGAPRSGLLLLPLHGQVDLRAKALHGTSVRADDGGASGRRSPSCWRRCGVARFRPTHVILEAPGENLSSVGSGRRQRTHCYLVGGVALEPSSPCGAAGSWRLGAVSVPREVEAGAAAPDGGGVPRRRPRASLR